MEWKEKNEEDSPPFIAALSYSSQMGNRLDAIEIGHVS
jgi:hypothetical protein